MKTLFIDTHLWNIDIALLEDGKIVKHEEVIDKKNNSEVLFPTLIKVIDNTTFDEIIVVNGPGSFTGVRLGVIIAKTLAYTKNIPIKAISSLECMAASCGKKNVAFTDNNGYYVGYFDNDLNPELYEYITKEEFLKQTDIETDVTYDYEKIYKYALAKDYVEPHFVNPIYIKKIGVEK